METVIFDTDNNKFIQQAVKFCNNIDKYTEILGVDAEEVANLIGDVNIVVYLSAHYHSFLPSFIVHTMNIARTRLIDVCSACISSKQYNRDIAIDLGLESATSELPHFTEAGHWQLAHVRHATPEFRFSD